MNNIIIIGNGFDLAHGLKTSYTDFVNHIGKDMFVNSHLYEDLITLSTSFKSNPNNLGIFFNNIPSSDAMFGNVWHNSLFKEFFYKVANQNWCDIERLYFQKLQETKDPKKLNEEFDIIKKHLQTYLLEEQKNFKPIPSYTSMLQQFNNAERTLVLNFNYTNCVEQYCKGFDKLKIINIHGELNNKVNPIIFGYAANHDDSRQLSNTNNNEYLINIKKHCYKRTNYFNQLTDYLNKVEKIDVSILGHSCGLSDNLILNEIFNHKNIKAIRVFYYKEHEQYFQSQINMDRIMNNDEGLKKIINFQESHSMPQFDINDTDRACFDKYIFNFLNSQKSKKGGYVF